MRAGVAAYDEDYAAYMEARGAKPRGWSAGIAKAFSAPQRAYLADYYRRKGADLS